MLPLPLILFLAALPLPGQRAAMECADTGTNIASIQTQAVHGPGGVSAVLKVSSADDHSKNSHECEAEYQLLLFSGGEGAPKAVDVFTSDSDYGRSLSLRLDGFSKDGKRVLGGLAEGGKYPVTMLLDYDLASGNVRLVDLRKQFEQLAAANCTQTFHVIGTTAANALVLETDSAKLCGNASRWLLDSTDRPQRLPQGAAVSGLYSPKSDIR